MKYAVCPDLLPAHIIAIFMATARRRATLGKM
jgi:hypothetical protein